jgi:Major Facilitator Superfamily
VHRIGLFIGPFLGAAAIHLTTERSVYLVAVLSSVATAVLLFVVPDVPAAAGTGPGAPVGAASIASAASTGTTFLAPTTGHRTGVPIRTVLRRHGRVIVTLGMAVLAIGAVRAARQTVLPLWAAHIGLNGQATSLIFGVASAVDMTLFYPSGKVMDEYGRLAAALPSMAILGAATALLPLTGGAVSLTVVAMVMSFGNGLGSGIVMTLGADVAPAEGTVGFLSMWRVMSDTGGATGPLVVSIVAATWTLAAGIVAVGGIGLLAAVALHRWVPRYAPYVPLRSLRRRRARAG